MRVLIEQVRVAVLSCARTVDDLKREAMLKFKLSYTMALRVLQAHGELQTAGHPAFQASGEYVELCASPQPDRLVQQLHELRGTLGQWSDYANEMLVTEPRLQLLPPSARLAAVLLCKRWLNATAIAVGMQVEIHGLSTSTEHNGSSGTVTEFLA